jgi:hypothetical protein
MRRVVSLFLPTWATDRLRRRNGGLPQPEVPLITAMQDGNQRVIAAVDEAARRLKLRPGMTIAHAQSLVPGLHIHDAMPHEDEAALARLALWCTRYSPLVATDPPDGIFIDIAGSAHLFKGETALLQDVKNRMAASKIAARAAVADTPGCAWAAARFGKGEIVAPGRASELLGSLPALQPDVAVAYPPLAENAFRPVRLDDAMTSLAPDKKSWRGIRHFGQLSASLSGSAKRSLLRGTSGGTIEISTSVAERLFANGCLTWTVCSPRLITPPAICRNRFGKAQEDTLKRSAGN